MASDFACHSLSSSVQRQTENVLKGAENKEAMVWMVYENLYPFLKQS